MKSCIVESMCAATAPFIVGISSLYYKIIPLKKWRSVLLTALFILTNVLCKTLVWILPAVSEIWRKAVYRPQTVYSPTILDPIDLQGSMDHSTQRDMLCFDWKSSQPLC